MTATPPDDSAAPARRAGTKRRVLAVAMAALLVVVVGTWWWATHRKGITFTAVFTASVGVYPGSDVRILGVPVGAVDAVTPQGTSVRITMHLDPGRSAERGTGAVIVSPNLVSDRYVQLTAAWVSGPKLRAGQQIGVDHTHTPVELDDLYRSLLSLSTALGPKGANADGSLSRLLGTGAANLRGNGTALNTTLTELAGASRTLSSSKDGIFDTIDHLRDFTGVLARNNSSLATVNTELASVSQTLADDRRSFADAMKELGTALSLVQRFVHDNRAALSSNVSKLNTVATTLAGQRSSLLKALTAAPLLVQNFINAYDPEHNVLRGRADLNELTIWAKQQSAALAPQSTPGDGASTPSGAAATTAPAGLLPASNVPSGGGR